MIASHFLHAFIVVQVIDPNTPNTRFVEFVAVNRRTSVWKALGITRFRFLDCKSNLVSVYAGIRWVWRPEMMFPSSGLRCRIHRFSDTVPSFANSCWPSWSTPRMRAIKRRSSLTSRWVPWCPESITICCKSLLKQETLLLCKLESGTLNAFWNVHKKVLWSAFTFESFFKASCQWTDDDLAF